MSRPQDPMGFTAEAMEGVVTPADRPVAAVDFGTTVDEQLEGEPLDGRLSRELPDPTLEALDRLETADLSDPDPSIGVNAESDDEEVSSEQAAMHVVAEEDAGLTDDPDGYLSSAARTPYEENVR